jgi:hypothetical protein
MMEDKLSNQISKTKEEIKIDIEFLKAMIGNLENQIDNNDINKSVYFSENVKKYADSINSKVLICNTLNGMNCSIHAIKCIAY